jgi:hypothetical protein
MTERGAGPRRCFANAGPGRLGSPSAPTTWGRPLWAGRGPDEGGRKPAGSGNANVPPAPEVTVPRCEIPRWSVEWCAPDVSGARAARRGLIRAPLGAPSPRAFQGGRKLVPAKAGKEQGSAAPKSPRTMALASVSFRGASEARERGIHSHERSEHGSAGVVDSGQSRCARFPE